MEYTPVGLVGGADGWLMMLYMCVCRSFGRAESMGLLRHWSVDGFMLNTGLKTAAGQVGW